jgi:hypothetical protein
MTATAWIAIAATVATLITSWLQFWLKHRSEAKKALDQANPATNQPKADKRPSVTLIGSLKQNPLNFLVLWLIMSVTLTIILTLVGRILPLNFTTGLLVTYSFSATVLLLVMLFRSK